MTGDEILTLIDRWLSVPGLRHGRWLAGPLAINLLAQGIYHAAISGAQKKVTIAIPNCTPSLGMMDADDDGSHWINVAFRVRTRECYDWRSDGAVAATLQQEEIDTVS